MANQKKKLFTVTIVVFMLAIGALVNPVRSGIKVIDENPLLNAIEEINEEDEGLWASIEIGLPEINMPAMVGAEILNSTATYPNMELWSQIDEDGEYEDIYNRYAHIYITLVDNSQETSFELLGEDVIRIFMTYDDLKTLGVKYIVRGAQFDPYDTNDPEFPLEIMYQDENYIIYEVIYE